MFALIPARGGSKGIPKKNIKELNGKPLIYYTIDAAREVFPDQKILVSTDDPEIKEIVERYGLTVPFMRPKSLALDTSSSVDVILHAMSYLESQNQEHKSLVLLQPTSPFRTSKHIQEAIALYNDEIDMVVSVSRTKSNPYYTLFEEGVDGFLQPSKEGSFTRRQDCPEVYEYNGAIYVINSVSLKNSKSVSFKKRRKYVMDEMFSHDIDTELDWILAESLIRMGKV